MKCPTCQANLVTTNHTGDAVVRNRALVLKADRMVFVCPRCKGDVPLSAPVAAGIERRIMLVFPGKLRD